MQIINPQSTDFEQVRREFEWDIPHRFNMAWGVCDKHRGLDSSPALLYEAVELGRLGRVDEQADALEAAERVFKANPKRWFNLKGLAGVAAQRGDLEAALAWLRQAVEAGMKSVNQIRNDPALRPLHGDDRFEEILDSVRRQVRP